MDATLTTEQINPGRLPLQILAMVVGCMLVYAVLFTIGYLLYGRWGMVLPAALVSLVTGLVMVRLVRRIQKITF